MIILKNESIGRYKMSRTDAQMQTQLYAVGTGEQADKVKQLYDLIDKYRTLCNMTWPEFLYRSIQSFVEDENPAIAEAIELHLRDRRKPGRPSGSSVKQKLYRMGVNPADLE